MFIWYMDLNSFSLDYIWSIGVVMLVLSDLFVGSYSLIIMDMLFGCSDNLSVGFEN